MKLPLPFWMRVQLALLAVGGGIIGGWIATLAQQAEWIGNSIGFLAGSAMAMYQLMRFARANQSNSNVNSNVS